MTNFGVRRGWGISLPFFGVALKMVAAYEPYNSLTNIEEYFPDGAVIHSSWYQAKVLQMADTTSNPDVRIWGSSKIVLVCWPASSYHISSQYMAYISLMHHRLGWLEIYIGTMTDLSKLSNSKPDSFSKPEQSQSGDPDQYPYLEIENCMESLHVGPLFLYWEAVPW